MLSRELLFQFTHKTGHDLLISFQLGNRNVYDESLPVLNINLLPAVDNKQRVNKAIKTSITALLTLYGLLCTNNVMETNAVHLYRVKSLMV